MNFETEILGKWENPAQAVHAALRGDTPAAPWMVKFCDVAAKDAEAYGDYDLAKENRRDAIQLKELLRSNRKGCSDTAAGVVKVCHKAGVEKVFPAIHHGCLHFLLSDGPENSGGIVFRDDSYSYKQLEALADEVNEILKLN